MPHQWVTFTQKISLLAQKMCSGERACVRGLYWREGTSCVSDTGLPSLTSVMSRLQGDISLVIRISTITENFGHIMGHIKKAFWARKIGPGWRGCSGIAEISQNVTFALWATFGEKPIFSIFGPNHSGMVPNGPKVVSDSFYHLGPFLNDLDQLGSKTEKMVFLPKIANPQSKHSETRYF